MFLVSERVGEMSRRSGKEMRNLMLAVTLGVLLLVLAVIAYFMVTIIVTTNSNIEEDKQKLIEESVRSLQDMKSVLVVSEINPTIFMLFNQDLVEKVMGGDMATLYEYATQVALTFYPVDYVGVIVDGELADYKVRRGVSVDPDEIPLTPPEGDYETLDSLGGQEGFYVSVFFPVELAALGLGSGEIYFNMIVERTEELAQIEDYFRNQRNDLILWLSIASAIAIILSILLTTFGLRYFTRKYVVRPIENLNRTAEEIADGTFEGEVTVEEESAYAALQGLLRSGQKVLSRMDEKLKE
jgi:HAMP domain-containing protein